MLLLICALVASRAATLGTYRINTASELITFSNNVNSGTTYEGTTVFLDSDIDFSGGLAKNFKEIGNTTSSSKCFKGTFDGQGHTISSLNMVAASNYGGLFGYSVGLTVRNVIMASSCSITASSSTAPTMGIIIGRAYTEYGNCVIENIVNMGSVTFNGDVGYNSPIVGGIAGSLSAAYGYNYAPTVKNCANYGTVKASGKSGSLNVGGIVGHLFSPDSTYTEYVYNCFNYGKVAFDGSTTGNLGLGGIVGYSKVSVIENCVSAGVVSHPELSGAHCIGSIAGNTLTTTITHSFWTSDVGCSSASGGSSVTIDDESSQIPLALSSVDKLNTYAKTKSWNKWLLNANNASISFKINDHGLLSIKSSIILLPSPADNSERTFSGWFQDATLTKPLTQSQVEKSATLYGIFCGSSYTVTLDVNGGDELSSKETTIECNGTYKDLPSPTRTGYSFSGWYTKITRGSKIQTGSRATVMKDHTLYAHWGINKYTITFDTRGGSPVPSQLKSNYLSTAKLPSTPTRNGCTVGLWETTDGEAVSWDFTVPANDTVLYAVWKCTHISDAEEFIHFSKIARSGATEYEGTTVFLDSDLDFSGGLSEQFSPIGTNYDKYFAGTFDGQGHTISNLKINSTESYVGLFGYSYGSTIRNVVVDDSCSVVSFRNSYACVSGIVGEASAYKGSCIIENTVNMASITFGMDIGRRYFYMGGIFGSVTSSSNEAYAFSMKNCANYGAVTYSGIASESYIGGLAGSIASSKNNAYLQNCLNQGRVAHSGTSTTLYLGGVVGRAEGVSVENCVSAGAVAPNTQDGDIAIISGFSLNTNIVHSFWTSDVGCSSVYGGSSVTIDDESSQIPLALSSVNKLNTYAKTKSWNKWLLNANSASVSFVINYGKGVAIRSPIILLPSPADNSERTFSGWFQDELLTEPFVLSEVTAAATLYGIFCGSSYTVTLDVNGGDELNTKETTIECNGTYKSLPYPTRTGCTFSGWYTEVDGGREIKGGDRATILKNHTLYARWTHNPYIITFDTRGGSPVPSQIEPRYLSVVRLPDTPTRNGCTVGHWETADGEAVSWDFTVPANDTVLYAVWKCTRISTPEELVHFSKVVNSGTSDYNGTTVFLSSDLDFSGGLSEQFSPIGVNYSAYFIGSFDGQGYSISNLKGDLKMDSITLNMGLFGYSYGSAIRNVVIDDSCSVAISNTGYTYLGGVIGYCQSRNSDCITENIVNMASVTFEGNANRNSIYIGGIAGSFSYSYTSSYEVAAKNCANYGAVAYYGSAGSLSIGGLIGDVTNIQTNMGHIQNCLNQGMVIYEGSSTTLYIGGVLGKGSWDVVENCVSAGAVASNQTSTYNGTIVGYSFSVNMTHSFWTSDVGCSSVYSGSSATIDDETSQVPLALSSVDRLNTYAAAESWNKWLLNAENASISFKINYGKGVTVRSPIILLPEPADNSERTFSGWFQDELLIESFISEEVGVEGTLYGMFCGSSYTVTLDVNGGDASSIPPSHRMAVECNGFYGNLPVPTKTEHVFDGWFTDGEGGEGVNSGDKVAATKDHTLYAHWTINNYTLTFVFGNGTEDDVQVLDFEETIVYPENVKRTGYSFNGWDTELERMPAHDLTVTALWAINNYTLTFVFGNGTDDDVQVLDFDEMIVYPVDVKKTGYTFDKWDTELERMPAHDLTVTALWAINNYTLTFVFDNGTDDDVQIFDFDEMIVYPEDVKKTGYTFDKWDAELERMPAHDLTVTALWVANVYTITFDVNGGDSVTAPAKNVTYDSTYGDLPSAERVGYRFVGWFTEKDEGGAEITSGDTVGTAGDMTLYARWEINTYTVSFVSNGGSECAPITQDYGTEVELPEPTKTGNTFAYWCSDIGLATEYAETTMPAANLTLYAKWDINQYNLTFVFGNGTEDEVHILDFEETIVYPEKVEKTGYSFKEWDNKPERMPADDITITALWTPNIYVVYLDENGGDPLDEDTINVTYDSTYGDLPRPTRTGYYFIGWFTEKKEGGKKITIESEVKITEDQTLYAHWSINQYTITFEANGGSYCEQIKQDYNTEVVLPEPTKTGYTFAYWCSDIGLANEYEGTTMPAEDKTLYAKWDINQYTLTFVFNNGAENEVRTLDFNEEIVYPENILKTGYTFDKWDKVIGRMPAESITITALWSANEYTVTFDVNGGDALSETESTKKVTYDSTYGDLPTPSRAGYGFGGWFTEAEGGVEIEVTTKVKITKDQILFAHWIAGAITVTFNATGGNSTKPSKPVFFDDEYGDLPEPSRTGYDFDGWFTEEGEEITNETVVKSTVDQTLYALWTANKYTVTFDVNGGDALSEESKEVIFDSLYGDLPEVTRTGYSFGGWYTDTTYANEITSESTVSIPNDHSLHAKWNADGYLLTFIFDNGTKAEERPLNYNDPIEYPAEPVKEGHTFNKWNSTIERMPAHDLTITALWTVNKYTVTFDFRNGSEAKEETLEFGKEIPYPEGVLKEGHTFRGWSESVEFIPARNLTITALWTINNYTLTFDFNNGDAVVEEVHPFNDPIEYPKEIEKEGHSFDKWDSNATLMPAHDLTITAQWTVNEYEVTFDFNNGTTAKETVKCGEPINYPEGIEKEGFKFDGWKPKPRTMPANNLTVKARWFDDAHFVEVILGTADLSESEILDILKKYAGTDFSVDRLEIDRFYERTQVIIRFEDPDKGEEFVKKVKSEVSVKGDAYIRDVTHIHKTAYLSYSRMLCPFISILFSLLAI